MNKKLILIFLMLTLSLGFALIPSQAVVLDDKPSEGQGVAQNQKPELPKYVPGEIIVKFKSEDIALTSDIIDKTHKKDGLKLDRKDIEKIKSLPDKVKSLVKDKTTMEPVFKGLHQKMKLQNKTEAELNKETFDKLSKKRKMPNKEPKNFHLQDVYILRNIDTEGKSIEELSKELQNDPNIEYAEPNYLMEICSTPLPDVPYIPNDYYISDFTKDSSGYMYWRAGSWGQSYPDMYGIQKTQTIEAHNLFDINKNGIFDPGEKKPGEGVVVAVIDTGVDYNHEDLTQNIWINEDEIPNNGIDDDGNGYIDDVKGWDFAYGDNDPMDGNGHGTHVSGTIAAIGNNNIGVIGIAPYAKIMPVKGLDDRGNGDTDKLADCVYYAANNGADVLSNSWGGDGISQTFETAFDCAYNLGCINIAAAGNNDMDATYFTPANIDTVIAVAATDSDDNKASFSNWGTKIDVAAPGVNILSLRAAGTNIYGDGRTFVPPGVTNTKYAKLSGTSMACPHVSGLCALIISQNPLLANEEVQNIIQYSSDDIGVLGKDGYFGYGRINAFKAVSLVGNWGISIDEPAAKDFLHGHIDIIGSAFLESGFKEYGLYYAPRDNPLNITPIASFTVAVNQGQLGVWNTTGLPDGQYFLILKLFTTSQTEYAVAVEVAVDNENQPPVFEPLNNQVAVINRLCEFRIRATDPDDPSIPWGRLEYLADHLPNNAQFDPATQIFSWQPNDSDKGIYEVTFTVMDNQYSVTQDILISTVYVIETQITSDSKNQFEPDIYEDKIVWTDMRNYNDNNNYDIYMYNLSTGEESQITIDRNAQTWPQIYGDKIIWADDRNSPGSFDIFMYNLSTNREVQISDSPLYECFPVIYQNIIAWVLKYSLFGDHDIYMYNLKTDERTLIKSHHQLINSLDIYQDKIIWAQKDPPYYWENIYMYDIPTGVETQITTDPDAQYLGSIYGDRIVWVDHRDDDWDIYMYEISSQEEIPLFTEPGIYCYPSIYEDKIVWADARNSAQIMPPPLDIYMYDFLTDLVVPITADSYINQDLPKIYKDKIVWRDERNGNWDIYMAQVFFVPQIEFINPSIVCPEMFLIITGNNFGYSQEDSQVIFENGAVCPIESWSNTNITCWVPQGAQTGLVKVITQGGQSNGLMVTVEIDMTPPVTSHLITTSDGIQSDSTDFITTSIIPPDSTNFVTVTLKATDNLSGVKETKYSINDAPFVTYTAPFVLSGEGVYIIGYRSIDNAGNKELPKAVRITITKPVGVKEE